MVGEVRGEETTLDQIENGSYLNSIALGPDATLSDLEMAADMATCTVSFRRFAREELTSTEPAPEIISGSLFIPSFRDRGITAKPFADKSAQTGQRKWQTWGSFYMSRKGTKFVQ